MATSLSDGQIVHVNAELNSVILNVGSRLGVRVGVPFRVKRGERVIGKVQAFEVREQICAALIEGVQKDEQLKVGDRIENRCQ